jgi:hypothetical protein
VDFATGRKAPGRRSYLRASYLCRSTQLAEGIVLFLLFTTDLVINPESVVSPIRET